MTALNNTKAKARELAEKEIDEKKALELILGADLVLFLTQLANDYEVVYTATGKIINLDESYLDELKSLLKKNYRRVSDIFGKKTRQQIEDIIDFDIYEPIPEAQEELGKKIAMAIGAYLLTRADDIAPKIASTIQDELIKKTNEVIVDYASRGEAIKNAEIASTVSNEFTAWGVKHSPIISTTEVQQVAEGSKYTENMAVGELAVEGGELTTEAIQKGSEKVWITAGDEKVRESHSAIDGKVIPADEAFVTGMGGRMMYCGDMNLGASLSDVINCRCETIYRYNTEVLTVIRNKIYRRK